MRLSKLEIYTGMNISAFGFGDGLIEIEMKPSNPDILLEQIADCFSISEDLDSLPKIDN